MQSLVHLQKIINLHRLSPDEFIPVAIFSSIDAQGIIRYYGRDNLMIEKNSFVVIGPEGILGRADYKNEDFFKLAPITQNEIRTPAMLAPQGGILSNWR